MGAPRIVVPPAPVLPPLPDQASIAVQQFGAMLRRRAAAGYESTFPDQPDTSGAPLPFRTDTDPTPPPAAPAPGTVVSKTIQNLFPHATTPAPSPPKQSRIVIDPATGLPTEVPIENPVPTDTRKPAPETPPDSGNTLRDLIARRFSKITSR